jgi:hypothetical protein
VSALTSSRRFVHGVGLALAFGLSLAGLIIGAITLPDGWWLLSWVGFATMGAFILWKRPGHDMGRLLLFIGLAWSLTFFLEALLDGGMSDLASVWVEMLSSVLGYSAFVALALIPVLFPHGTPATGFDRFLSRALLIVWGTVVFCELISPAAKEITGLVSPLALEGLSGFSAFMLDQGFLLIPLLLLVALGSLVRRWRASSGVERLQYPWLMTAIGFVIVVLATSQVVPESVILDVHLVFIALNAIPAAIGVAILRYRLYDIDKLISRTVSYAVVAAVLVAVYAGSALALGALVGRGNPLAVAGATLAAAALFTPLRRRVQRFVERRFDRSRYDAELVVDEFSSRLRQEVDLDGLSTDLTAVVTRTLRPATVSLWLKGSES